MSSRSSSSSASDAGTDVSSLFSRPSSPSTLRTVSPVPSSTPSTSAVSLDSGLKARVVHIPLALPPSPRDLEPVSIESLVVDEDLRAYPVGFVVHCLRKLGPQLQESARATCLCLPSGPDLPEYLPCHPPVPSTMTTSGEPLSLAPSHVLSITSRDSPRRLLVPVHGLLWASYSPILSLLSSHPSLQPSHGNLPRSTAPSTESEIALPVVPVLLPSSLAFALLSNFIYSGCTSSLFNGLLPRPSLPTSLARMVSPTPSLLAESVETDVLLRHIKLVHGLWQDVVALEIGEEKVWKVMRDAWEILVGALRIREVRRREESFRRGLEMVAGGDQDEMQL